MRQAAPYIFIYAVGCGLPHQIAKEPLILDNSGLRPQVRERCIHAPLLQHSPEWGKWVYSAFPQPSNRTFYVQSELRITSVNSQRNLSSNTGIITPLTLWFHDITAHQEKPSKLGGVNHYICTDFIGFFSLYREWPRSKKESSIDTWNNTYQAILY